MYSVKVYPWQFLVAQRVGLGDGFVSRFPNAWILWEPVRWKPSNKGALAETLPTDFDRQPERPPDGEPHCYALPLEEQVVVGRAPDCDLRINDAAVSRRHLILKPGRSSWRVAPASAHSATLVRKEPLASSGTHLGPGDEIRLGGVILMFQDTQGLAQRIDERRAAGAH